MMKFPVQTTTEHLKKTKRVTNNLNYTKMMGTGTTDFKIMIINIIQFHSLILPNTLMGKDIQIHSKQLVKFTRKKMKRILVGYLEMQSRATYS